MPRSPLTFSDDHASAPDPTLPERTGRSSIERLAVSAVARDIAAMPASLVVQLALWPDELARWARRAKVDESVVYNALAYRKPYQRVRERLAERLEVTPAILAHLIEAHRPQPAGRQDPGAPVPASEAVDWSAPPYPAHRDGSNPIERRAVATVTREIAALPPSTVVGLALWPETLAGWSRARRLKPSVIWAVLAGAPSAPVRDMLARRLGVSLRELGALVDARRATPAAYRPRRDEARRAEAVGRGPDDAPPAGTTAADPAQTALDL